MGTVGALRDTTEFKKEIVLNVGILSKVEPMPAELYRLIFKEHVLEKPTKILFNQLSYYLVFIIDKNVCASLTWPLNDSKDERAYRTEFANFVSDYSSKGFLSPVMSSYLVKPACYKVTKLMFELSQLAVNRILQRKMRKDSQKEMYAKITEMYKTKHEDFVEFVVKETRGMHSKFSNYLCKRKAMEKIARLIRDKITSMQTKLSTIGAQSYIDNLVDRFLEAHDVDDETRTQLLKVKNIEERPLIFDAWLEHADATLNSMETTWITKMSPLLQSCQNLTRVTEAVLARSMGECDPSTYTVEYNHRCDEICTKDLQNSANSEQKYVLRNLVKDGRLNFPNLIRAFVISVCFILKQSEITDDIYNFNECLERKNYSQLASEMRTLIERIVNAEAKLTPTTVTYDSSMSMNELPEIPSSLDLSTLTATVDSNKLLFDTFTPLNLQKNQFNMRRRNNVMSFVKPQPKSLMTSFYRTRSDFSKAPYDLQTTTVHNNSMKTINRIADLDVSIIPNVNIANQTNLECSSGFTKQQILRLLSTKKSSSSKKHKYSIERPNNKIKKRAMFNESNLANDSNILFRSYSSPNLFENKERRSKGRRLSIMEEDSLTLDMSGIAALNSQVNSSSQEFGNAESSRIVSDTSSMPSIVIRSEVNSRHNFLNADCHLDANMDIGNIISPILEVPRKSVEHLDKLEVRNETPKPNSNLISKTSSLEKIINRFKKVKEGRTERRIDLDEFKTIVDEKVNSDVHTANRCILPDLLSLNSSGTLDNRNIINMDVFDNVCLEKDNEKSAKCRQSLGTVLGVDENFLDQFDFID